MPVKLQKFIVITTLLNGIPSVRIEADRTAEVELLFAARRHNTKAMLAAMVLSSVADLCVLKCDVVSPVILAWQAFAIWQKNVRFA